MQVFELFATFSDNTCAFYYFELGCSRVQVLMMNQLKAILFSVKSHVLSNKIANNSKIMRRMKKHKKLFCSEINWPSKHVIRFIKKSGRIL